MIDKSLSEHFRLKEMLASKEAIDKGIVEQFEPSCDILENIQRLVTKVLEPLRLIVKFPIVINSGYRCYRLNILDHGVPFSYHMMGSAADLSCCNLERLFIAMITSNLPFTELIAEDLQPDGTFKWLHIAYDIKGYTQETMISKKVANLKGKIEMKYFVYDKKKHFDYNFYK